MKEVTGSFSASSCSLTSLTQILSVISVISVISSGPFCWCHFSWALSPVLDKCVLHLSPFPVQTCTRRSLYFLYMEGLYTILASLPLWLIFMLPDITLTPVNILLAAPTDMHMGESISLPGNSEARNYLSHGQHNMQSSQEWIDPWLF